MSAPDSEKLPNGLNIRLNAPLKDDQYPDFTKTTSPRGDTTDSFNLDEIIPPPHPRRHRTLVLCFDGTGDQFDDDNSNIVNFFSLLKKDDSSQQLVYYQAGIGTYTIPQIAKPMMAKMHKAMDTMVGVHLDAHVMSGYEFLMQNYEAGDKISIFGFSRGAYTARALGGMYVGLLPKCNHQQVPFAYKMYSREDEIGWRQSTAFKKAFSIDVDIDLVGVWDTVGSVGVIPKRLPFTTSNTHVKHFRHAIALDERRVRFKPNFWNRPAPGQVHRGTKRGDMPKSRPKPHHEMTMKELERHYSDGGEHLTNVEEVWFAGCHCDVGGGAVKNEIHNNLARIPLRWMVRQCFLLNTGILFHKEMMKGIGMDPDMLYPKVLPRPPPLTAHGQLPSASTAGTARTLVGGTYVDGPRFRSEEEEDLEDALCKIHDMLNISKSWWLLELIPQKLRYQMDDDNWVRKFSINRGRGRAIPRQKTEGIKIHRTVKIRMEAEDLKGGKYKPKAKLFDDARLEWVD
ncbi:hypothetical protein BD779DRAFT_1431850 [Infundibulicybe gibba]|nr:hypothetical protein BD779DRAFT_1431850 [Infundibulicybe gibba]